MEKINWFFITDRGDREINEDAIGAYAAEKGSMCYVCADGLGGHGKGEVASAIAVRCADELVKEYGEIESLETFFHTFFNRVEKMLGEEQKREQAWDDMKTTAVIAVMDGQRFRCAHIGDSRLYYFRKNRILFRTHDHSVPQMLVLAGELKERKIRNHPDRNRLLRVLGMNAEEVKYDISEEICMEEGDAILLCTDGFWELIGEKEMVKTLRKSKSAEEWGNMMREIVRKHGRGREMDNYSAICVKINKN